jgi:hypothetical protein
MSKFLDLLYFCKTDRQTEIITALVKGKTQPEVAREFDINERSVRKHLKRVKDYAASRTISPEHGMNNPVPDFLSLDKMTDTRTNDEGKNVWYKYSVDKEQQAQAMIDFVAEIKADLPVYKSTETNTKPLTNDDLLNCFIVSDYHLGLVAYESMTKDEDWNTEKAESILYKWFDQAIASAPPASTCLFIELGDYGHIDNQFGTTPRSGHVLDHDVPMNKLIKIVVRSYNAIIHKLAAKYKYVHVMVVDGNHNDTGAKWSSAWLAHCYQDFTNVTIDDNEDSYFCYEFGKCSIFAHHGHIRKMGNIQETLLGKFRNVFGRTNHSFCHLGHMHHIESKETGLMVLEQHRTLSAKDNHAAQGGYNSGRSASVITYHKELGEVSRLTISRDAIN